MAEAITRFTKNNKKGILIIFLFFSAILLVIISLMAVKNYLDSQGILEESIDARMISMATATREAIDPAKLDGYNSYEDMANDPDYPAALNSLRMLAGEVGAEYLYILKKIDGKYYFIYDTDVADDELFVEYEITDVHAEAFKGKPAARAYGNDDVYGSFSTGAVPIYYEGRLIGVASADIDDNFIERHKNAQFINMALLIFMITVTLAIMAAILSVLLGRIKRMQDKLYSLAHYDKLTNLPNRQYLMEHLTKATEQSDSDSFALFFIDLDNFKKVNDTAGHDAGDELLKNIGSYLNSAHVNTKAFRPSAGALNVAARIGGDEFILVAPNLSPEDACIFAREIIEGLRNHVPDKNIEKFSVGFSIGIALYPGHTRNFHVLLKYADIAMYHAKNSGKNSYMIYNEEMKGKDEK